MSPEQSRGEPVDSRSDIFSFGVVFYEMLAGIHPFRKNSLIETANAIVSEAPAPLTKHLLNAPPLVEYMVGKMLDKSPARRYQHFDDLRIDLEHLLELNQAASPGRDEEPQPRPGLLSTWRVWAPLGGLLVISLLALFLPRSGPAKEPWRFVLRLAAPYALNSSGPRLTLSGDGRNVFYLGEQND